MPKVTSPQIHMVMNVVLVKVEADDVDRFTNPGKIQARKFWKPLTRSAPHSAAAYFGIEEQK